MAILPQRINPNQKRLAIHQYSCRKLENSVVNYYLPGKRKDVTNMSYESIAELVHELIKNSKLCCRKNFG